LLGVADEPREGADGRAEDAGQCLRAAIPACCAAIAVNRERRQQERLGILDLEQCMIDCPDIRPDPHVRVGQVLAEVGRECAEALQVAKQTGADNALGRDRQEDGGNGLDQGLRCSVPTWRWRQRRRRASGLFGSGLFAGPDRMVEPAGGSGA
jgi:hypothetical protein